MTSAPEWREFSVGLPSDDPDLRHPLIMKPKISRKTCCSRTSWEKRSMRRRIWTFGGAL